MIYSFSAAEPKSTLCTTCLHGVLLQSMLKQLIIKIVNLEKLKYFLKEGPRDTVL